MQTDKIAVIELSTKAVKWLIPTVDNETIQNRPFSFKHFYRMTEKTETGNGLKRNNVLDEKYFCQRVLPWIKKAYNEIKDADVDVVYCVATAVYRSARNINSILQIIKDEIGIEDVRVLTEKEEAEYTFWAYYYSTNYQGLLINKPYTLLIDQGGGSTEITLFLNREIVFRKSFDFGTTVLKNDFFSQYDESIVDRLQYIDNKYKKIIFDDLNSIDINNIPESKDDVYCIGVGTAITTAIGDGVKANKDVHEKQLSLEQIQDVINTRTNELLNYSPTELQTIIENKGGNALEKIVSCRLGLPIISEILRFFNVQKLRISGTGLWYGVFFANFYELEI